MNETDTNLRFERDILFDLAWNLRALLLDYERNVDDEAPPKHREFMARARELLNCGNCQGFGDDGEATCQKCGGTGMRHHPLDNPTVALHAEVASLTARLDKAPPPAKGPEETSARVAIVLATLACEQRADIMVSLAKALGEVPEPDAALAIPGLCLWAAHGANERTSAALERALRSL